MGKKILTIILVVGIPVLIWHYSGNPEKRSAVEQKDDKVYEKGDDLEQKVQSFVIDGRSAKGVKQWHLEGDSAEIHDERIHLNKLKAIAYGDDSVVNLISDRGIYDREKEEVELIGNVEVVSDDGVKLTTDKANWSQTKKEINTDSVVHITHKSMNAVGTGGMANSDKEIAVLRKDVTVKMEPSTTVTCDGSLDVDYKNNVAVFHDNVKVVDKDGDLTGDKLTVDFDPETRKISQVTAEGNVRVKKGNSYTMSEKAIYTESTKSAKLLGKPRVVIDPEQIEEFQEMEKAKEEKEPDNSQTTIHTPRG